MSPDSHPNRRLEALRALYRRASYRVYRTLFPRRPWIAPAAIRLLRRTLTPSTRMIEWGSGRSTTWFAQRVGFLLSIESSAEWHARVSGWLAGGTRAEVDYRFEPITAADRAQEPGPPGRSSRYVLAVDDFADSSFDVALVDGELREACIEVLARKLKADGLLVLDNSNWLSDDAWGITGLWEPVMRSPYSGTETTVWQRRAGTAAR